MFKISTQPISSSELQATLKNFRAGACATFEGWVRNRNQGQEVRSLEYEAYTPLAEAEGARILAEAGAKYGLLGCAAVHRIGHLQIGELAVWVGVAAEHREAAFHACQYIIDEAKARLPIWKKEHYVAGSSVWINSASREEHAERPAGPAST
ncbi:MAG: molybdenum cofactor biosynthesis protein MoaE [Verrucomicrobia bacterium]|nr:molybdenum cofactor biosynthesis protein MoaE [Verrucomicrobiota bacterium]